MHRTKQWAVFGLIGLSAVGCGLQGGHPGTAAGPSLSHNPGGAAGPSLSHNPSASPSSTAVGGPCTAAQLKVTLDLKSAGVAAGTSLIPLDFTNTSAVSCRLTGFAAVSFVTSNAGRQVGAAAAVDRGLSPRNLRLVAGDSAHLWLRLVEAANFPASACGPKTAAGLLVRLPGQATSIFVAHQFTACAKRLRGTDILTVEPFQAGRARAGTAQ
jgi:hypothetical protein